MKKMNIDIKLMRIYVGLVTASFAFGNVSNVNAALVALEYGSTVDNLSQEVTFFIKFNEAPDFFTVDSFGRQAGEFQYYIDADALDSTPHQNHVESIVRGGEIHLDGDIRIRDRYGYDGTDTNSGGWGPILGSVPYTLSGTLLSFTTPWSLLKDDDGIFTYQLLLTEYGSTSDLVYGLSGESYLQPSPVPLPAAIWLFVSGLAGFFAMVKIKKLPQLGPVRN